MSASHLLYGLRIVTNLPIPGLTVLEEPSRDSLQIRLKTGADFDLKFSGPLSGIFYSSSNSDSNGDPTVRAGLLNDGAYYGFFYSDGARFAIERHGREIWADWPDGYSLEDACTYLVGQVINFVLRLRGTTSLHASSIEIGDRAIAMLGEAGAGKSTTAAAFAKLGHAILSDDVAVLAEHAGQFLVLPGYPRVNLWPDSVRALFGWEDALPLITPTWGKRYLALDRGGCRFRARPLPLGAIYVLCDRDDALVSPLVEELSLSDAFLSLVANTYGNHILNADMQKREFDVLGRVAGSVPVRRVCLSPDPSRIMELCEMIAGDAQRIAGRDVSAAISESA